MVMAGKVPEVSGRVAAGGRLARTLFIAMAAVAIIAVGLYALVSQYRVHEAFRRYLAEDVLDRFAPSSDELGALLARHPDGEWTPAERRELLDLFARNIQPARFRSAPPPPARPHAARLPRWLGPPPGLAVIDAAGRVIVGPDARSETLIRRDIEYNGQTVGALVIDLRQAPVDQMASVFLANVRRSFTVSAALALLVALLLSAILARSLLRPLKRLAVAAGRWQQRDFEVRADIDRDDELGQLARQFNAMAEQLQQHERLQRQWLSDVAHELRTPLTILQGQIEAMIDGVREPSTAGLRELLDQAAVLTRIVEDLQQLSAADQGRLTLRLAHADLRQMTSAIVAGFEAALRSSDVTVAVTVSDQPVPVCLDKDRFAQVLSNIFSNIERYATRPARVVVEIGRQGSEGVLVIEDSGPGVPEDVVDLLFDRFYRVETSRSRVSGGSGLGLAICRSFIEAHGGTITASNSIAEGLRIEIRLPLDQKEPDDE
ncbi:MAG: HAMP domain-containing protein [Candidatus Dadabacteria bacterium]|nr:MAG: HAMP domain-containing protein [Candidatus Dadabacteria bacterium]